RCVLPPGLNLKANIPAPPTWNCCWGSIVARGRRIFHAERGLPQADRIVAENGNPRRGSAVYRRGVLARQWWYSRNGRIRACLPQAAGLPLTLEGHISVAVITGSAGLVGSEAVRHFAGKGLHIAGIDNDMRRYFFGPEGSTKPVRTELESSVPGYEHHNI